MSHSLALRGGGLWLLMFFLAGCGALGRSYQLEDGQSLAADQHLVAVQVDLAAGSQVLGDLNITADNVYINGRIDGDLTVFASELALGERANISGDVFYCLIGNAQLEQATGAQISGEKVDRCTADIVSISLPGSPDQSVILRLLGNLLASVIAGLLAVVAIILLPRQIGRISRSAYDYRLTSFGMGFLTWVLALGLSSLWSLSLVMIAPIVLSPLIALGWGVLFILSILGGIGLAQPFGVWLSRLLRLKTEPVLTALLGAGGLSFLILLFRLMPSLSIISTLLGLALAAWGLGAVLITRVGTRPYDAFHRRNAS